MRKPLRRKCKVCGEYFVPKFHDIRIRWCCPEHGAILAMEEREKEKVKAAAKRIKEQKEAEKAGRQRRAARRNELRPIRHWVQMTQRAFNDWRREMLLAAGTAASPAEPRPLLHGMRALPHHGRRSTASLQSR